ncbi:hypothetical protein LZ023_38705 (plasmid) [Pseudomonas silvicola]|nr:hypothetical protein LZ023_38705 [Pseudomonas silvicola]
MLLAALGEIYSERSGVLNIGIEGTILLGALASYMMAVESGSTALGFYRGWRWRLIVGCVLAALYLRAHASQVVVGIVFNIRCRACIVDLCLGDGQWVVANHSYAGALAYSGALIHSRRWTDSVPAAAAPLPHADSGRIGTVLSVSYALWSFAARRWKTRELHMLPA